MGYDETDVGAAPLLSLPMGPCEPWWDNRVGWIPNCEDAAPSTHPPTHTQTHTHTRTPWCICTSASGASCASCMS